MHDTARAAFARDTATKDLASVLLFGGRTVAARCGDALWVERVPSEAARTRSLGRAPFTDFEPNFAFARSLADDETVRKTAAGQFDETVSIRMIASTPAVCLVASTTPTTRFS